VERRAVKVAGAQVEERAAVEETANAGELRKAEAEAVEAMASAGAPPRAAAAAPGVARDVVRGAAPALPRQKPDKTPE
jgi:hypothetical protein